MAFIGLAALVALAAIGSVLCEDETIGPIFMKEPPNRIDFSNTTGATVECAARGSPTPDIIWVRADGSAVGDVPGLRQVQANGNLLFPPFRAEDYRQEVHAQVYACLARNSVGTIHSRDVNVRAVVAQHYDTDVNKEYVILGNSIVLKCQVPSFVADFVEILSWHTDDNEDFFPGENYVVQQQYESEVNNEYVIRGNSAIVKCSIPSFVADFVNVVSWQDEAGNSFTPADNKEGDVVTQYYEAEVVSEYVIRGNTAVLKCNIPSFVADFVKVEAWVDSDGGQYLQTDDIVVNQFYEAEILTEYVIRGNAAVLKCSIPSFVADFVKVEAWIDEEGAVLTHTENLVVSQYYVTEAENEYVIRGNAAIVHCKIPSFVSDFVYIEAWVMDDGEILTVNSTNTDKVVSQPFEAEADNEYVIRGNAAIMKCEVPSFVSDFVYVEMWMDSEGGTYYPNAGEGKLLCRENKTPEILIPFIIVVTAVLQVYEARVNDEFVLRGNTAIMKCIVPSFVGDFVNVVAWIMDNETVTADEHSYNNDVVRQSYEPRVTDEDVLRGNSAILKCVIPSFVADYVHVVDWVTDEDNSLSTFSFNGSEGNYAVNQFYESQVYDIYVIRGNAAVFKCHIPSFVSDHVQVISWHDTDGGEYALNENYVVSQAYTVHLVEENVLRGNSAIVKCLIPSFVTEYVSVASWIISEGEDENEITISNSIDKEVVSQIYTVNLLEESVLRGNAAIFKCHISTFVTEYVSVSSWIISEGDIDELEIKAESNDLVVSQAYTINLMEENVLRGNAAIVKCHIPSFVTEYVIVSSWIIFEGDVIEKEIQLDKSFSLVVSQSYTVNLWEENVLRGNAAILKCHIPSFVTEYVTVTSWIISEGDRDEMEINLDSDFILVVSQAYDVKFWEEYVLRGNAAILKCQIPSFVAEYVSVNSWIISEDENDQEIKINSTSDLVVSQAYAVNLMEEYVLRGNSAILKCHIPSFVSEYVTVISWIINEDDNELDIKLESSNNFDDGKYLVLPSGELHIRDVGPEDGYKSYQCRTKHRLTGETRLSATKGRLVITEPVGRVPPKFPSASTTSGYQFSELSTISVLCPAQAYPAPMYRTGFPGPTIQVNIRITKEQNEILSPLEPVGRVSPKFTTGDKSRAFDANGGESITMLCPAQAYPAPAFRYKLKQPVGRVPPKFPTLDNVRGFNAYVEDSVTLLCPAQAFPVPLFRWYKFIDGTTRKQPVTLDDRVKQVSGTLIIKEAKVEDSGKYLCVVNNSVGGESVETVLTVTAPLKATVEPATQTVDFGRPAVFTCRYEGNPVKTVTWLKDGKDMKHHDATLRIESVKKEDKGMYQCFIRNDQESASASAELKLGGRFEPPLIRHSFGEQTFRSGPSLRLKCVASGNPTPDIAWLLDGDKLNSGERLQIGQFVTADGNVESHLNISSVHTNDGGLYTCIASSKVGSATHSARVNVYGLPYVRPMKKRPVVAGDNLIVHCPVAGYPIESIVWERDNRVLPINRKQKVFSNGTLVIENVERMSDEATYTCVAKNSQGYTAKGTLEVQVMVPPQLLPFEFGDEPANAGDMASLTCAVSKGDQPLNITWVLNGQVIPKNNNMGIVLTVINKKTSILNIDSVSGIHRGTYLCVATNMAGSANHSAVLEVNVPPQITPFEFGEEILNEGETASVSCVMSKGDLPVKFTWRFNGEEVKPRNNLGIVLTNISKKTSILNIDSVSAVHRGSFTCEIKNDAVPPQISPFEFGDEPANAGDTASVQCVMNKGDLPANFSWSLNGRKIAKNNNMGIAIGGMGKKMSILNIDSVNGTHRGIYVCYVENLAGQVNHSSTLEVNVLPQIHPFTFGDEPANAGDAVGVQCMVTKGDTPINITWLLNEKPANEFYGITVSKIGHKSSTISIDSVASIHTGVYTCLAMNRAGHANYSAELSVNVLPQIHPFTFGDEPANAGDAVGVQCMVTKGDIPINITWLLNGKPTGEMTGISVSKIGHKASSLSIDSVGSVHAGVYTCLAANRAGHANYSTNLSVNVLPQMHPFSFGDEPANAGDTVAVQCIVTKGDSPVNITWLLNGKPTTKIEGITVTKIGHKSSSISIDSVASMHTGVYTCLAVNRAGYVNYSTELAVNVLPQIHPFTFGEEPANSGDTVGVQCMVTKGESPVNITWLLNGKPTDEVQGITVFKIGPKSSSLSIDSVASKHTGVFTCLAANRAGHANYSTELAVNVLPQIHPFTFGDEPANAGDTVGIQCMVTKGDSPVNITWLLNGKITSDIQGITVTKIGHKSSSLSIDSVTSIHTGIYTCLAENQAGHANYSADLAVNVVPQVTPFDFGEDILNAGDTVSLTCTVGKGDLPLTIHWQLNNQTLNSGNGIFINRNGKRISVLSIENVQHEHIGNYTCIAENEAGRSSHSAILNVNVPPQIKHFEFGDGPVNAQEMVLVTCAVSKGDLPLKIEWYFNGNSVKSGEIGINLVNTRRSSQLNIDSVSHQNQGNYTCVVKNAAGAMNYTAQLFVNVAPVITHFEFDESVFFGEGVQVMCHVPKGDKPLNFKWAFSGGDVSSLAGLNIMNVGDRGSALIIPAVTAKHSGNYTCTASNIVASASHHASLNVKVPPHIVPFMAEEPVFAGESVQLTCHVSKGDAPITISWSFHGKDLSSHQGITTMKIGERTSLLTISSSTASHSGEYSCHAANRAGLALHSTTINVHVLPYIVPFEADESVFAGEPVQLTCHVSKGDLPLNIKWHFHGFENSTSHLDIMTNKMTSRTSFLSISGATAGHSGNYTCVATNRAGSTNHSTALNVHVVPHIIPFEVEESIFAGESVHLTCHVSKGDRPLQISWSFDGHEIPYHNNMGITTTKLGEKASVLSIPTAMGQHSGNYTCTASNRAGRAYHSALVNIHGIGSCPPCTIVTVKNCFVCIDIFARLDLYLETTVFLLSVPPHILPFEIETIYYGESVQMVCHISKGDRPMSITWTFEGKDLSTNMGIKTMKMAEQTSFLSVASVTGAHSGNYTCIARNKAGEDRYSTTLNVKVVPHIKPFELDEAVFAGESVHLDCHVSKGDTPVNISWSFQGQPITRKLGVKTTTLSERVSVLDIPNALGLNSGNYTCTATNKAGTATHTALLNVIVPPNILPFTFGEKPTNVGEYLQAACTVNFGDLPLTITWMFNEQQISPRNSNYIVNKSKRSSLLIIESVDAIHAGTYSCIGENRAGRNSHSEDLVVYVPPLIMPFNFGEVPFNPGDTALVNCLATKGDLPLDISWTFSSETIDPTLQRGISTTALNPRASLLTIISVSANHQGNYTCIVKNAAGRAEYAATLVVNGTSINDTLLLPRIVPFSFETPLYAGQASQVTCLVSEGDQPLDIQWFFEGKPLREKAGVTATKIAQRASLLLIDPAGWSHSGSYACIARNAAGISNYTASLEVHVPPRWILEPTDKAFAQGSDAKVECKADGFPKPQVTWKRAEGDTPGDYKDLKPNNPNVKVEDGTLAINNIQKTNEGYYLCEAVNGIGSGLSAVILISVQAPPQFEIKMRNQTARRSEPAVLQCQAKGEKPIGIIWNMNNKRLEPKSDPRYTIREEILPGGVVSDLSIRRTERSDSALFTCVATNAFGSDDTSINMIIQEVPEAPYGLKVLDKSGRTVQLSWAAPYDGNSPINKFLIEYKRAKGNWDKDIDRVLVPGDATEAGVFSLRPATAYHIRIVAENDLGTSEPSETVTIITAEEAPTGPPQDVKVDAVDKHTLRVTWKPPPPHDWNGELQGYYVGYKLASSNKSFVFETVDISKESGKEHHLDIMNLKTYTQYAIVVQTFNKMGSGPISGEVRAYTAEGAPSASPQDVLCTTLTAQTIRVSWVSPPLAAANGLIKAYKVVYGPSETWYDEKTKDTKITASSETILHGLKKFTNYSMEVLATTNGGDGVRSAPIHCQTEQDVPEAPRAVKALVMGSDSILVSWRPPAQPNGVVTHYNVYTQAQNAEPHPNKVPSSQTSYSATDLKAGRYDFWVTAATMIGEGQPSATASCSPSDKVPAKIASFDESFTATYKEDVKLPCLAVGVPPPNILWKVKGNPLDASERVRQLPEGSLQIAGVAREDAGEYSCHVDNQFGTDTVTHTLSVLAPPFPPQLAIASSSVSSLTLRLKPSVDVDQSPAAGYTIHYKQEFGDWETVQIPSSTDTYTLENLFCGSRYQLYVTAYNGIGTGEASDVVIARTRGSKPPVPRAADFIEVASSSVTLHLKQWLDGGCPMSHFVVENKKRGDAEWNQISNAVKPGGNFVVLDLEPATWYVLRITAHNNAGFNVAEYDFGTLTITGGTIAPARDVGGGSLTTEQTIKIILSHLNLIVPVVAAILVIIIAIVVVCVVRGARDHHKDDAVYNASQAALGGGGGTLDKRGGLRDELGYIAPPNRKLPPVPGSNYNTCDRVKRQAVIMGAHSTWDPRRHHYERVRRTHMRRGSGDTTSTGMEDEICPYATFHLLGFREEMDPSKALAFPHHHPAHAGTLAHPHPHHPAHSRAGSQSMPRANSRYARKNSQGGQSAIYSTAPEYDDPATCAEEDQYRARYSRPMYACGPEYDEPACCAPEDEQYTGAYGTPYSDHYGSRPSIGTRKCGSSPEPPPPPPRNTNTDNNCSSSFNESKDSNEISEAECDQPRNYPVRAHTAKDGMHSEEMRKLIDRSVL
ncbi:unnamed protein product [Arctia plantaginis]|uniref:Dscam n=1 Tax=Arctia plantaginis TaxID=874455 RepID=A0A8S0YWL7_ARCPL|nr:unnamed protein product [Arctia plantaginis]